MNWRKKKRQEEIDKAWALTEEQAIRLCKDIVTSKIAEKRRVRPDFLPTFLADVTVEIVVHGFED